MTARWGGSCGSTELAAPALQHAADALHFWIVGNENLNEKQKVMLWPLGGKKDSGILLRISHRKQQILYGPVRWLVSGLV